MEDNLQGSECAQGQISQSELTYAGQSPDNSLSPSSPSDFKGPSDSGQQSRTSNEEVSRDIQILMEEMQRLRRDFDNKVKYDESKERLIDSLHMELQTYREGLHFKILHPVFMDLISMHDDLGKLLEDVLSKENEVSRQMLRNLESFQESIEEILRRNGVEAFSVEETTFVSGKQRVLRVVVTSDLALDKRVARRVRKGFEYDGRVLRPEIVEVYRAVAQAEH
jgi:molecular chaperone GrpE